MRSFAEVLKDSPAVGDVHISSALGGGSKKRRARRARAFMATEVKDVGKSDAGPILGLQNRRLNAYDENTMSTPFRYDPSFLGSLREDQVPGFLHAVTHQKRLDKIQASIADFVAIKNMVDRQAVQQALDDPASKKPPVVVSANGEVYLVCGDGAVVAAWLNGEDSIEVRFLNVDAPRPVEEHDGSRLNLLQPANGRRLPVDAAGALTVPFPYNPALLSALRPEQIEPFLQALAQKDDGEIREISINGLTALQRPVNPDAVAKFMESASEKPALIIGLDGAEYIADGHNRLSAVWLSGADTARVRYKDLTGRGNTMKSWRVPVQITKTNPEQFLVFGFASTVTKNGKVVLDKQDDMIEPHELERAAYEFVLESREQGDMHSRTTKVGRLVESIVFTEEKQKAINAEVAPYGGHIDLKREAWFVGFKVDCPDLWSDIRGGKKLEFSIGGSAVPVVVVG